jgi:hypothetical protein
MDILVALSALWVGAAAMVTVALAHAGVHDAWMVDGPRELELHA